MSKGLIKVDELEHDPSHPRIFVGGGQDYYGETAARDETVTRELAHVLFGKVPDACIVTGGTKGIPAIFSDEWDGDRLDIVSDEHLSNYIERMGVATSTVRYHVSGRTQEARRLAVTALEGIVCAIFIQGGQYSTHEIKLFQERGIPIVVLRSGGGAAGGKCPYKGWSYQVEDTEPYLPDTATPMEIATKMANEVVGHIERR